MRRRRSAFSESRLNRALSSAALSLRILDTALERLSAGGTLILYTGAAVVDGIDPFRTEAMARLAPGRSRVVLNQDVAPTADAVTGGALLLPQARLRRRLSAHALDLSAVAATRRMMGVTNPVEATPGSLRGDYALEIGQNLVHGSDSEQSAAREIGIFFPGL